MQSMRVIQIVFEYLYVIVIDICAALLILHAVAFVGTPFELTLYQKNARLVQNTYMLSVSFIREGCL